MRFSEDFASSILKTEGEMFVFSWKSSKYWYIE